MRRIGCPDARSCILILGLIGGAALITAGALLSLAGQGGDEAQAELAPSAAAQERPAPDFSLLDLNGRRFSLAQFRGQPVVINFWATWCPPCRDEIPRLVDAYQREKDGVAFVAISDEAADVVAPFVKENAVPYVNLLDGDDRVSTAYGIKALPTTVFISRDGEIKVYYTGAMSARIIEEGLRRIK